jgi:endonuclease-3
MDTEAAEAVLLRLAGLSWKGTRCVLLYSLGREAFPVDSNVFRVLKRIGVVARGAVYRRRSLHDKLQDLVRPERRRALHINLVVHGQRTCLPRAPKCGDCAARPICAMAGVPGRWRRQDKSHHDQEAASGTLANPW